MTGTIKSFGLALASTVVAGLTFIAPAAAFIDEARLGGHWLQPEFIESGHAEVDQLGISAELLFTPFSIDFLGVVEGSDSTFLRELVTPRAHFGGMVGTDNNSTHYVYGGLTWHFTLTERLFAEGAFGMAYTNADKNGSADRAALGAYWQFREAVALGVNLTESMTAVLQIEHLSHRDLFGDSNRGLSNMSLKVGYKF